jgi:hypothetical protein
MSAMRRISLVIVIAITLFAGGVAHAASKLKGFYSGSGGISQDVFRTVMIEFHDDGTATVQQSWVGKDPQKWHARWKQEGKTVNFIFDAEKGQTALDPLLCDFKHGTLVPTKWDVKALGVLGPPKLMPFGGKVPKGGSAVPCQAINGRDPSSQHCPTWDSRDKK